MRAAWTFGFIASFLGATGAVHALPITDVHTPQDGSGVFGGPLSGAAVTSYAFSHDLNSYAEFHFPGVTSATLTLDLTGGLFVPFRVFVDSELLFIGDLDDLSFFGPHLGIDITDLSDGVLEVVLEHAGGDAVAFILNASTLFVDGTPREDVTPVPEPSALALLGAGLLSMILVRRRRSKGIQAGGISRPAA